MTAISWIIVILDIGLAIDAVRRPASVWAAADRRKGFWVTTLLILGVFFVIPYAIGVLPRLNEAGRTSAANDFQKDTPNPFGKS